jgi:hypothetical protein
MIKDPLVDWLKSNRIRTPDKKPFTEFIKQKGKDFESSIVTYIRDNKIPIVSVSERITPESCAKTLEYMKEGVPIIHSAPFRSSSKHIQGVVDFLIRSDFLQIFTGENPLPSYLVHRKAPNLNGRYHYVVMDIKFSTLPLRADGTHLLNSGSYPAYKSQLWIYTQGIGELQGYTPTSAYLLGRRYRYTSKGENFSSLNCFDKIGVVDFDGIDGDYIDKTERAINWLKDVKKNGKRWSLYPPSRVELYPNMCIDSGIWNKEKQEIANKLGDITQIWYCGVKNRDIALSKGISSWRDERCDSKSLGINGVRARIIDEIISINKQNVDKVRPSKIRNRLYNWRTPCNEIFVDFETFTDIFSSFDDLPIQERTNNIFMIGVWYKSESGYRYKNFVAKKSTDEEEFRIMDEFVAFVRQMGNPKLWYWYADKGIWKRTENKQMDISVSTERSDHIVDDWKLENWADLCDVFRDEPIVIKDCFKFGLKEVANALRKHGFISTEIEGVCKSGIDASVIAWQTYETSVDASRDPRLKDIAIYNKFDVKVLWEILNYIRANH